MGCTGGGEGLLRGGFEAGAALRRLPFGPIPGSRFGWDGFTYQNGKIFREKRGKSLQ